MANIVKEEHFVGFGGILYQFARYELTMLGVMSQILETDVVLVNVVIVGLGYAAKRDAYLGLLRAATMPADQLKQIEEIDNKIHDRNRLRNAIAHSTWRAGARPNSIKPLHLSVRGGKVKFRGVEAKDPDFTPDELLAIANELIELNNNLTTYLKGIGLLPAKSIALNNSSTAEEPGSPSAK